MVRMVPQFLKMFVLGAVLALPASQAFPQATFNQYLSAANKKYSAGEYESALKYYKAAAQLNQNSAAVHQGMGNSHYGLGQKREALRSYDRALQLDPSNEKLQKFTDKIRAAEMGKDDLPTLEPAGTDSNDLSTGMENASEEDAKKYNKWTSGRNYTKNMMEIFIGPVFLQGGTMGFGFGSSYFFPASKGLFVGVAQNAVIASQTDIYGDSMTRFDFETLLLVKYKFEGNIRPMIFGGGGLNTVMWMYSGSYYSSSFDFGFYPEVTVGGGVDFQLGNDVSVFVQSRLTLMFGDGGTATNIPVEIGFSFPVN